MGKFSGNDLERDKAKADRFERWFEEDGLKEALEDIKEAYVAGMLNSHYKDKQARENCYIAINLIDRIEGHIHGVIGGGKMADKTLQAIEREAANKKVFKLFN